MEISEIVGKKITNQTSVKLNKKKKSSSYIIIFFL
jgi:hypothetical protein